MAGEEVGVREWKGHRGMPLVMDGEAVPRAGTGRAARRGRSGAVGVGELRGQRRAPRESEADTGRMSR
jgi:hypothetical protein